MSILMRLPLRARFYTPVAITTLSILATACISDSDQPSEKIDALNPAILITPLNSVRFSENGGKGELTVVLNTAPDDDVTLQIVSDDPSEVKVENATLRFTQSNWSKAQTVQLTAVDDDIADDSESVSIEFAVDLTETKDKTGYKLLDPETALVTVDDDETAIILANLSGSNEITESPQADTTIDVSLGVKPDDLVVIDVSSNDTTEATVTQTRLTFTADDYDKPQQVVVSSVNDTEIDPVTPVDIIFTVNSSLTAATRYNSAENAEVTVNVVEDLPPLTIYINDLNNESIPDKNDLYHLDEDGNIIEITELPLSYNFSYVTAYDGDIYSGQWTLIAPNNETELTITRNNARIINLPDTNRGIDGNSIPDVVVTSQGIFFLGAYTADLANTVVFQYDHNGSFIGDYDLVTDYSNHMVGNELGFMNLSGGVPDQQLEFFDPVNGAYNKVISADLLVAFATAASRDQFYVCGKPDKDTHILRAYNVKGDLKRSFGLSLRNSCRAVAVTEKAFYVIDEDLKDIQTTNYLHIYDRTLVRDTSDNIISESMSFRKTVPLPSYYVNKGEDRLRVENIFFDLTRDVP